MYILIIKNESFSPLWSIERKKKQGLGWLQMNPPHHSVTEYNEKYLVSLWKIKCDPKKSILNQRNSSSTKSIEKHP